MLNVELIGYLTVIKYKTALIFIDFLNVIYIN